MDLKTESGKTTRKGMALISRIIFMLLGIGTIAALVSTVTLNLLNPNYLHFTNGAT